MAISDVVAGSWDLPISRPRPVSPYFLAGLIAALLALSALANFVIFPNPQAWCRWGWQLDNATGGLLDLTLTVNLAYIAIVVVGGFVVLGKQTGLDLGLVPRKLP